VYNSDENVVIAAPTGSGKTGERASSMLHAQFLLLLSVMLELAVLRAFGDRLRGRGGGGGAVKAVYIGPLK
jgi:Lhr-like helicase